MSRISIDVTDREHKRLKAMAALSGQSIKDYVLDKTLGKNQQDGGALVELEKLLDDRIRSAKAGAISRRNVTEIFEDAARKEAK